LKNYLNYYDYGYYKYLEDDDEYDNCNNGPSCGDGIAKVISVIAGPAIMVSLITQFVASLIPFFMVLYIPSFIFVLTTTVILSSFGDKFTTGNLKVKLHDKNFRRVILRINSIAGFIIVYIKIATPSMMIINQISKLVPSVDTVLESFLIMTFYTVLYASRLIIPIILIPLAQRIIWKALK